MRPCQAAMALLDEILGVGPRTAEQVLAERGIDMTRFKTSN